MTNFWILDFVFDKLGDDKGIRESLHRFEKSNTRLIQYSKFPAALILSTAIVLLENQNPIYYLLPIQKSKMKPLTLALTLTAVPSVLGYFVRVT